MGAVERTEHHGDLMVDLLEKEEEHVTFSELMGVPWEDWLARRRKCLYVLAKFKMPLLRQIIPVAILPKPVPTPLGPVVGYTLPQEVETVSTSWREIGQAQMNIVEDKGLVWECLIWPSVVDDWETKWLPLALDWLEDYLRRCAVRVIYMNPYEPAYEGYDWREEEGIKPRGWWSEFLKKRGYKETDIELFNRKVLIKELG